MKIHWEWAVQSILVKSFQVKSFSVKTLASQALRGQVITVQLFIDKLVHSCLQQYVDVFIITPHYHDRSPIEREITN